MTNRYYAALAGGVLVARGLRPEQAMRRAAEALAVAYSVSEGAVERRDIDIEVGAVSREVYDAAPSTHADLLEAARDALSGFSGVGPRPSAVPERGTVH